MGESGVKWEDLGWILHVFCNFYDGMAPLPYFFQNLPRLPYSQPYFSQNLSRVLSK